MTTRRGLLPHAGVSSSRPPEAATHRAVTRVEIIVVNVVQASIVGHGTSFTGAR
jgi:hypothetical protein